jgi:hypothetical protein
MNLLEVKCKPTLLNHLRILNCVGKAKNETIILLSVADCFLQF